MAVSLLTASRVLTGVAGSGAVAHSHVVRDLPAHRGPQTPSSWSTLSSPSGPLGLNSSQGLGSCRLAGWHYRVPAAKAQVRENDRPQSKIDPLGGVSLGLGVQEMLLLHLEPLSGPQNRRPVDFITPGVTVPSRSTLFLDAKHP